MTDAITPLQTKEDPPGLQAQQQSVRARENNYCCLEMLPRLQIQHIDQMILYAINAAQDLDWSLLS